MVIPLQLHIIEQSRPSWREIPGILPMAYKL